jgi:hypothetical protein
MLKKQKKIDISFNKNMICLFCKKPAGKKKNGMPRIYCNMEHYKAFRHSQFNWISREKKVKKGEIT